MKQPTSARAPILVLLVGLVIGLLLAQQFKAPISVLLNVALIGGMIAVYFARHSNLQHGWALCFVLSAVSCFWAYGIIRLPTIPSPHNQALPAREAQLSIEIERVMYQGQAYNNPSGLARVLTAPPLSRINPGDQIYFRLKIPENLASEYRDNSYIQSGLQLSTTGVLTPILADDPTAKNAEFETYLTTLGVHYRFDRTETLEIIRKPPVFAQFCGNMNQRFQQTLHLGAPEQSDLVNVYIAMLLGRRLELTDDQTQRFQMTGTMHFFAISGLHIGVIAAVIAQFLLLIRIPHNVRPWIGLPLLYLYVEITGSSPSALRAFLMTAFFWLSFALQRQRSPFAALIGSALLVLAIDPIQLWSIGFQLSYTVVASILLFGLPLYNCLTSRLQPYRWRPEEDWNPGERITVWLVDKLLLLFAISFSAWLASTPLSAALFECIIPGAILLNMLLVNLVALVITGGVISLVSASLFVPELSEFLNHSAWAVIHLMDLAVIHCAQLPGTSLPSVGFSPILSYAILGNYYVLLLWLHRHPQRLDSNGLWLPPLLIIGTIAAVYLILK